MFAVYGTEANSIDVSKKVKELYEAATSHPVSIAATNANFGDPVVGSAKRLDVYVRLPSERFKEITCNEGFLSGPNSIPGDAY